MTRHWLTAAFLVVSFISAIPLRGSDDDAKALLREARNEYKEKDYYSAASKSLDAEHMADSVELKAEAVKLAVLSYRKEKLYYREFQNIEKLLSSYSSQADYASLVKRQFEIGDAYYKGHRDPAYYALRWVPWLYDEDRTIEIYEKALSHAPYSESAATAKLRTAVKLIEEKGELEKAMELFRGIVKDHPDTPEAKMALLRLGVTLAALAEYGDGDGAYNREAIVVLNEYKNKYPEATELDYVNKLILRTRDIQAQRLMNIADFYRMNDRSEVTERYLGEVIRLYPDTKSAEDAERMLTEMDKTYIPQPVQPAIEPRLQSYDSYPIPEYRGKLLITPQQSDGKYLRPFYDLGLNNEESGEGK